MGSTGNRKPPLVADRRFGGRKPSTRKPSGGGQRPRKPARNPQRGGPLGWLGALLRFLFRLVWGFTWRVGAIAALALGLAVGYVYTTLPDVSELVDGRARGSVTFLDRDGAVFARRGEQFGGVVTARSVSPHLRNAVVATEDKRFYSHFGVSPRGIASAIRINLREGRGPLSGHGGSTITQQSAKLMCLGVAYDPADWKNQAEYEADCRRGSLGRKAKEAIFALAMELKYTKDEILTVYLNRAYMGGGAYGAEAAAQRFFSKPASDLTAPEAAMLAGLLTAPTTYAPTNNLGRSQDRAATVLRLMAEQGLLSEAEAAAGQANPAVLSEAAKDSPGGAFADWVMSTTPDFLTRNTTEDVIIRATLDQRMQAAAEAALNHVFATKVKEGSKAQAAVVVMSADGAVRAMVGGRDMGEKDYFNRATLARRQTGSAFKPFVYAAALDVGWSPLDTIEDAPYCQNIPGSGEWCPRNYTGEFYGTVSLADALKNSLNIPAVKLSEAVGRDAVRTVAAEFGLESDLAEGPALALGASESTLIEMTGAYAGILNGGSAVTPYGLVELRLKGESEPLMGAGGGIRERVIREEAALQLVWMMERVVSQGTGARARMDGWEIAGKTGTTQAAKDAWFVGFTADYVAGVWIGNDDNTPLTGVTGGGLPAEIWHEVMVRIHEGLTPLPLPSMDPVPPTKTRGMVVGRDDSTDILRQVQDQMRGSDLR